MESLVEGRCDEVCQKHADLRWLVCAPAAVLRTLALHPYSALVFISLILAIPGVKCCVLAVLFLIWHLADENHEVFEFSCRFGYWYLF